MQESPTGFFIEGYNQAIHYYNDFMNRSWLRYNIMLTLNAALFGIFLAKEISDKSLLSIQMYLFITLGVFVSLLTFWIGFNDYKMIHLQRKQIFQLRNRILNMFQVESFTITDSSLSSLKLEKLSKDTLYRLKEIKDQEFTSEVEFIRILESKLGKDQPANLIPTITQYSKYESIPILFSSSSLKKRPSVKSAASLSAIPATTGFILLAVWLVILFYFVL